MGGSSVLKLLTGNSLVGDHVPLSPSSGVPIPPACLLSNPVQLLLAHGGVTGALQGDALEARIHTRLAAPHAAQVILPCR